MAARGEWLRGQSAAVGGAAVMDIDFTPLIWFGVLCAALPFIGIGILIGWTVWG